MNNYNENWTLVFEHRLKPRPGLPDPHSSYIFAVVCDVVFEMEDITVNNNIFFSFMSRKAFLYVSFIV